MEKFGQGKDFSDRRKQIQMVLLAMKLLSNVLVLRLV